MARPPRSSLKLCPSCVLCAGCAAAYAYGITPQELVIIRSLCNGAPNKIIARELDIAEDTVKRHLSNIMNKVGLDNRTEVAMLAIRKGWATA